MVIECSPYSQRGTERSNPQGEACEDETVSRNASELDSASLVFLRVASLPCLVKPVASGKVTFICSQRALRGVWRQRAVKEKSRNQRDPITVDRESDTFIVVKKGLINLERREVTVGA